ncbi:hypothetical protein [Agromyces sp. NBRC 114283]|uniref:hypothetical protein n=1 Tax=Agromyces sp. NBRC 114283 TaxID=2994521 RepID=UPI00249FB894|nr:hypothetical protein [Agromyces sp. NBRC 114283]GLU91316.1 hypothetical protein Agsp01_35710 [Agromyces sp. NBRC 114283]
MDTTFSGAADGAHNLTDQTPAEPPRFVGIDFSLTATGIAVIDGGTARTELVKTRPDDGTIDGFTRRCASIVQGLFEAGELFSGDRVAIEGVSMHSRSSSLDRIYGGWWLVASELQAYLAHPIVVITPSQRAKYATGKGNAGKDAVLLSVARRYPDVPVADNNEADALVLAAMIARLGGRPIDIGLPLTHIDALAKVRWDA